MLQFSLTKKILIWGVCALGVFLAAPNLFYTKVELANDARARIEASGIATPELQAAADEWPSFLPSSLVNLGLDLRGGAHLLAEVHVEDAARKVAARLMEANAGFLAHTDAQIGRLVATLEAMGELDDTIFVYIVGDNGASAEGGVLGSWNYVAGLHGIPEDIAQDQKRLDSMGGTTSTRRSQ